MRRRIPLTIAVLGSIVTLLGFAGLIAPFTDRATTGTNSVETGARGKEVDLKLALRDSGTGACGAFSDDLTTGLVSAIDVQPDTITAGAAVCLKNEGASAASLSVTALNVTDTDTGCTGDESVVDLTCGGNAAGELSPQLGPQLNLTDCPTLSGLGSTVTSFLNAFGPLAFPSFELAPGGVVCVTNHYFYFPAADDATKAQSDEVTWQYAFDGNQVTTP